MHSGAVVKSIIAALLCGIASASDSEAAASYEVSLRNLQLTVVDLNLSDGITAGFDFDTRHTSSISHTGTLGESGIPYNETFGPCSNPPYRDLSRGDGRSLG